MHVIGSFTLVPVNSGLSLSRYIAACGEIIEESGLEFEAHSNGTNIEGSWDSVFQVMKDCQRKVHDMGVDRIFTTIQIGTRTDKIQKMSEKRKSVDAKRKKVE